jgi:hypothetical protein
VQIGAYARESASERNIACLQKCTVRGPRALTVTQIAKTVAEEMNTPRVKLKFTGGVDGGRGWKGDVKTMQLSIDNSSKPDGDQPTQADKP